MEDRSRKIATLLKLKKRATVTSSTLPPEQDASSDDTQNMTEEDLELAIKALDEYRQEEERKLKRLIGEQDKVNSGLKEELEMTEVRMRERDQELKTWDLKVREVKRTQVMIQA